MARNTSPEFALKPLLLLSLILALAAVIRFHNLGQDGLWRDELLTVEETTGHGFGQRLFPQDEVIEHPPDYTTMANAEPWYHIFPNSRYDTHPPLIHLVLRVWRQIVPDTDAWLRTLMVLLSLAAITLFYLAIATQAGPGSALWGCLIMSLASVQVEYAQECRNYMLLLVCLLSACVAVLRIEKFGFNRYRGLALGAAAFAAALTHYLGLVQLGILFLYILIRLRGRDRLGCTKALVIAGFLYCAIWGPFLQGQRGGFMYRLSFAIPQEWTVTDWLGRFVERPTQFLFYLKPSFEFLKWPGLLLLLLPVLLLRRNSALLLWWLWLVCGMAAVAMGDLVRHAMSMGIPRYTVSISLAMYALIPLLLWHLGGWRRHLLPALAAAACAIALPGAQFHFREDWRVMNQFIASRLGPDDIRIMHDTEDPHWRPRSDLEWMMFYDHSPHGAAVYLYQPPDPSIEARIRAARAVWYYIALDTGGNIQTILPGARILESHEFPMIGTLQRIELPPMTPPATTRPAT